MNNELFDAGRCGICKAKILLSDYEVKERDKKISEMTKALICDSPIYGYMRRIALPPYPCGHQFIWEQKCRRAANGKYIYDI